MCYRRESIYVSGRQYLRKTGKLNVIKNYFDGMPKPKLAVALEFEDNLVDWSDAVYEVQMLI